jgi:hypothetical protein
MNTEKRPRHSAADIQKYSDGRTLKYPNTDWYDAVIKPTSKAG